MWFPWPSRIVEVPENISGFCFRAFKRFARFRRAPCVSQFFVADVAVLVEDSAQTGSATRLALRYHASKKGTPQRRRRCPCSFKTWFCATSCCVFFQVLGDELSELKRRRAQLRADNRELAKQEKNAGKRRARLLQAGNSCIEARAQSKFLFQHARGSSPAQL